MAEMNLWGVSEYERFIANMNTVAASGMVNLAVTLGHLALSPAGGPAAAAPTRVTLAP
jgi:hypothetical protein